MLLFGLGFNFFFFIKKKTLIFLWSKLNIGMYVCTQSLATNLVVAISYNITQYFFIRCEFG